MPLPVIKSPVFSARDVLRHGGGSTGGFQTKGKREPATNRQRKQDNTVFIDGIGDEVTYWSLKKEVIQFGRVHGVYLQRRKRQGRLPDLEL